MLVAPCKQRFPIMDRWWKNTLCRGSAPLISLGMSRIWNGFVHNSFLVLQSRLKLSGVIFSFRCASIGVLASPEDVNNVTRGILVWLVWRFYRNSRSIIWLPNSTIWPLAGHYLPLLYLATLCLLCVNYLLLILFAHYSSTIPDWDPENRSPVLAT